MSGENNTPGGDWNQWDGAYRGKFYSGIREWLGRLYATDDNAQDPTTNQQLIILDGSIQPTDDILLEGRYLHIMNPEEVGVLRSKNVGDEVDLRLTYDYTEDVSFGLLSAWFFPGEYYQSPINDIASELVGSVVLTF
ncbi:unnamed protein product [marine sediment metagenome]|uniref:Alginate export domain-containing protein n=1 Tax=marine sediment metagenome TaxID=412755 RepID=X1DQH5_9ZZZZ